MLPVKATASMMNQRQHSKPKSAVVLIMLLFVLLSMLHPTHLGTAPIVFILAACFLFGIVQVATCCWHREEAQFLPRAVCLPALFDRPPPFLSL
jgi:protein-S-isoprenylcysteine O-methyltransferase Ste14